MSTALQPALTAEEFGRRPDPGYPEDLVRGRIVSMPPPTRRHGQICNKVGRILGNYADEHDLGHALLQRLRGDHRARSGYGSRPGYRLLQLCTLAQGTPAGELRSGSSRVASRGPISRESLARPAGQDRRVSRRRSAVRGGSRSRFSNGTRVECGTTAANSGTRREDGFSRSAGRVRGRRSPVLRVTAAAAPFVDRDGLTSAGSELPAPGLPLLRPCRPRQASSACRRA